MLRRQHHESGAPKRIGTSGEHGQRPGGGGETDLRPPAASDPVALHQLDALRPIQALQVAQQPVGVSRDAEEPLHKPFLLDQSPASPAAAVHHLFVGQHRLFHRVPVHGGCLSVGQPKVAQVVLSPGGRQLPPGLGGDGRGSGDAVAAPPRQFLLQAGDGTGFLQPRVVPGMVELQENPLGPTIVLGLGGVDLPAPVKGDAQQPHLPLVVGGEAGDELGRVGLQTDGGVFRGETEGVPAHGMEHVLAPHAVVAAQHVGGDVVPAVAHAETVPRRVGKEIQHIPLGAAVGRRGSIEPVLFPSVGPLGFDPVGGVFRGHDRTSVKRGRYP